MDNPCKYCEKAEEKYKHDLLKCKKPCNLGKQYKKCESDLIAILQGKPIEKVIGGKTDN